MSIREIAGRVVNVPLMANPMNWVIVIVMLIFVSYSIYVVSSHFFDSPFED